MAAMLSVSFFLHSIILPLLSTAEHPEHNERNIISAFTLVGLCYAFVGVAGYLAFGQRYDECDEDLPQIILQAYDLDNIPSFVGRCLFFFQLMTVYPLLLLISRVQVRSLLDEIRCFEKGMPVGPSFQNSPLLLSHSFLFFAYFLFSLFGL